MLDKIFQDESLNLKFSSSADECLNLIKSKNINAVWGISPAPPIHLGYDKIIFLLKNLQKEGISLTIVLADIHAMLAQGLSPEEARVRRNYFHYYLKNVCEIDASYLYGSSFQMQMEYIDLLYRIKRNITVSDVKKALPSAVSTRQQTELSRLSTYTYTAMQVIDPIYLESDLIIADQGQRKIYDLGHSGLKSLSTTKTQLQDLRRLDLSELEYPPQIYLDLPFDIQGQHLNKSSNKTRISIHENAESLRKKIKIMYVRPHNQPVNPNRADVIMDLFKFSVFPWSDEKPIVKLMSGSSRKINDVEELSELYELGEIHPNDFKEALYEALLKRLEHIKQKMSMALIEWVNIDKVRDNNA